MSKQEALFIKGEGDEWFKRNKSYIDSSYCIKNDIPLFLIKHYNLEPKKVLEVGCANGYRLGELKKIYNCDCLGIEPSEEAIADGKRLYPDLKFKCGTADSLPIDSEDTFDLVIINFVFHWVSRETLLRVVAEIDKTLANGGYLIIGDFLPDYPVKNHYHHLPEESVYTYKLDYAKIFLSTGFYTMVASFTYNCDEHIVEGNIPPESRGVCSLLIKSLK